MPVNFRCPHCGVETLVADEFVGHTGACARCGQPITVHGAPGAGVAAALPLAPTKSSSTSLVVILGVACVVLLLCGGVLLALLLPAVQAGREAGRRAACKNNLRQIGIALHNYNSRFGCFPPAYLADADGKPMHSWRVLILEDLGRQDLFAQYDFNQPWDSPTNQRLANRIPSEYLCPSDSDATSNTTSYVAAVGPDRMFPGTDARTLKEVTDGLSNTIAVMEYSDSDISWLEPRDGPTSHDPEDLPPRSDHSRGWHALFGDASVHWISDIIDPQTVEGMMTVDGGEAVVVP